MNLGRLYVVISCADRKRSLEHAPRLRDLPEGKKRDRRWWSAINSPTLPKHVGLDLYLGPYWSNVLSLVRQAEMFGWTTQLWIISAGYGLVPASAQLSPYQATFAPGHPDSVSSLPGLEGRKASQNWWQNLSGLPSPAGNHPRTIEGLMARDPSAAFLVAASPAYLSAVEPDLLNGLNQLADPNRLLVISGTPGPSPSTLQERWIPSLEIFRQDLGGACITLNPRVAARAVYVARTIGWSAPELRKHFLLWSSILPPLEKPRRIPLSDNDVSTFIQKQLVDSLHTSYTAMLRQLRDMGLACERSRFKALFELTRGVMA